MNQSNPWLAAIQTEQPTPVVEEVSEQRMASWQPGQVVAPSAPGGLRTAPCAGDGRLWVVAAHGGAGATTVAHLLDAGDAGQVWPAPRSGAVSAVVVARHHLSGLRAAQAAAIQWASGVIPGVHLVGLVLVADSPVKQPKELADFQRLVMGAFPAVWHVEYVSAWRVNDPWESSIPRAYNKVLSQVGAAFERNTK